MLVVCWERNILVPAKRPSSTWSRYEHRGRRGVRDAGGVEDTRKRDRLRDARRGREDFRLVGVLGDGVLAEGEGGERDAAKHVQDAADAAIDVEVTVDTI